jgi:hypothetical protein
MAKKLWTDGLTESEINHLTEVAGSKSLEDFKTTRREQKRLDSKKEVCYECRHIAIKLGIEK